MNDLEFVSEPPPPAMTPATRQRREVAATLKARPGEWARVYTGPKGTAEGWRSALNLSVGAFRGAAWQAVRRLEVDGRVTIYARYLRDA